MRTAQLIAYIEQFKPYKYQQYRAYALTLSQFYLVPFPAMLNKVDTLFSRLENKLHEGMKKVTKVCRIF